MITKFLDPKNDFAFKRIFGSKKHKNLLISFLNAVLESQISSPIQDLVFLKTVQDPDVAAKKQSIVDVLCQDEAGVQYIVEMQVAKYAGFEARAQYYASKAYIGQMEQGDQYHNLKEVIFLAIADYIVFTNKEAYKSEHRTLDRKTGENDLDKLFFTFVELPKFNDQLKAAQRKLEELTLEEKWYYFLSNAPVTTEQELEVLSSSLEIKEAYRVLDYFSLNAAEVRTYEQAEKAMRDELAIREYFIKEATQQGREEGIEIGKEKGIEIGKEKGREEGIEVGADQRNIAIAQSMLSDGDSVEKIQKWTGVSLEQINAVQ
jgi:predicted transposase/invertase (TIGR01784 family)